MSVLSRGHIAPVTLLSLVISFSVARPARADTAQLATPACLAASSDGQTLRDAHKAIEARDKFRTCAQASCPAVVRRDCTEWANAIESTIPSVVITLKDAAGTDVVDATVTMDGQLLASALCGTAIGVNPGPHVFRFDRPDGTSASRQLVVAEGQKNVVVAATFADLRTTAVPPTHSTMRTVGWVVGAVGVVGLVTGGVFGGLAIGDKGSAGCNAANKCTNFGSVSSAKTAADVADIGLIGGGAAAAVGATLLVLSWRSTSTGTTGWLTARPSVASSGGGLVLIGGW